MDVVNTYLQLSLPCKLEIMQKIGCWEENDQNLSSEDLSRKLFKFISINNLMEKFIQLLHDKD